MQKDDRGKGTLAKGYRPLNEGYTPKEQRGVTAKTQSSGLPKAPKGGTGASGKLVSTNVPTKMK